MVNNYDQDGLCLNIIKPIGAIVLAGKVKLAIQFRLIWIVNKRLKVTAGR